MAKTVRFLKEPQSEFQKVFQGLCYTKSSWQVWSDFIGMTATAIANAVDQEGTVHDERERLYMETITKYTAEEQQLFPRLVGILVQALEQDQEQDFLGEMFMALELGSHWHGQFFTPYNICKMMAAISIGDVDIRAKADAQGWFGVMDPACGAGALLVAARNALAEKGLGTECTLYVAQDIDRTAALMCYIQLSLLGCAGYVVIGDSLCHPTTSVGLEPVRSEYNDVWEMPMFRVGVWAERRMWHQMDRLLRAMPAAEATQETAQEAVQEPVQEASVPVPAPVRVYEPPEEPEPLSTDESGQLTLF